MNQNPLDKVPPIGQSRIVSRYLPDETEKNEERNPDVQQEITKGSAPRDLKKTLTMVLFPIAMLAMGGWFFYTETNRKGLEKPVHEVDDSKQTAQANAHLTDAMKSAEKAAPLEKAPPPPLPAILVQDAAPQPVANDGENRRREDEILGAQLEATGNIQLIRDQGAVVGSSTKDAPKSVEEQLAAHEAKQAAAVNEQEKRTAGMLAVAAEGENARVPSENEAFIRQVGFQLPGQETRYQQAPVAQTVLLQGTVVRTVLMGRINSDLPGTISARVTSDVYDSISGRKVLIPKGSIVEGAYNSTVVVGQERVLVAMQRLILPDGTWVSLLGDTAADMIGTAGLEADVNNHFWKMFSSSFILGAVSMFMPDSDTNITVNNTYGGDTSAGSVVGMAMKETMSVLLQRNKNISPTLTVEPGQQFTLRLSKDMVMRPYVRKGR